MSQILYHSDLVNVDDNNVHFFGIVNDGLTLDAKNGERVGRASTHQVFIAPLAGATGTVIVAVHPHVNSASDVDASYLSPILDSLGSPVSIDLSAGAQRLVFDAHASAVAVQASGISGSFNLVYSGW